jgi:hypothetical protein
MYIFALLTDNTLSPGFGHLEGDADKLNSFRMGNDTPLTLTVKGFDAQALAVQIEVDENSHDVSFQD